MGSFFIAILTSGLLITSAITHENDIYNQCARDGDSGKAMWTHKIKCSPIIEVKTNDQQ